MFKSICDDIGVPLVADKTTSPTTKEVFLVILLDSARRLACLSRDKLLLYQSEVRYFVQRSSISRRDLESLVGKLVFAPKVVPARPFLRRLYDKVHSVVSPFQHVRITESMRCDLEMLLAFFENYNGITYFRALQVVQSTDIKMASDASRIGFGACYGANWIQGSFPTSWQVLHITILELYAVFALVVTFSHKIRNSNINLYTDWCLSRALSERGVWLYV